MIEVFPLSETKVNWESFLKITKQGLGRNVTSGVDAKRIPCDSLKAYLMCLGEMSNENSDAIRFARDAGVALRQVSVSFCVATTTAALYQIGIGGCLGILEADHDKSYTLAIVSGNLEQWRSTIINGSAIEADHDLRLFCNRVLAQFEKMDLGIIFDNYAKRNQSDYTFALVAK